MGLHQDSITEFEHAIAERLQIGESLFLMGQSCIDLGQLGDAAGHFRRVLQTSQLSDTLQLHTIYRLGLVCEALGESQEASRCFNQLTQHSALFPDVLQRINRL